MEVWAGGLIGSEEWPYVRRQRQQTSRELRKSGEPPGEKWRERLVNGVVKVDRIRVADAGAALVSRRGSRRNVGEKWDKLHIVGFLEKAGERM